MSGRVHEPGTMEIEAVPKLRSKAPGNEDALSPKVPRADGWNHEAD